MRLPRYSKRIKNSTFHDKCKCTNSTKSAGLAKNDGAGSVVTGKKSQSGKRIVNDLFRKMTQRHKWDFIYVQ